MDVVRRLGVRINVVVTWWSNDEIHSICNTVTRLCKIMNTFYCIIELCYSITVSAAVKKYMMNE